MLGAVIVGLGPPQQYIQAQSRESDTYKTPVLCSDIF